MKRIINGCSIIVLLGFSFAACKKDDVKLTTAEKVQGTWQFQSEINHQFVDGVDHSDTTSEMNEIVEFAKDGKFYITLGEEKDSSTYTLSGDTQITINNSPIGGEDLTYEIKTLTSSSFVLYTKVSQGADYSEETIYLIK